MDYNPYYNPHKIIHQLFKMTTEPLTYSQLELAFTRWASSQPDVRAVVVIGSRARVDHPASEWSDLDLLVFTNQPGESVAKTDWLASIGEVQFTARERFARDDWIPLVVIFTGMRKVDIVFTLIPSSCSPHDELNNVLAASPYPHVFSHGIKILYDRYPSNTSIALPLGLGYSPSLPSQDEFTNDVNLFWVHAIHTGILIQCGERWRACNQLQVELKGSLLIFIERQARLHYGMEHKIWPRGCYLEDWADQRILAALPQCFSGNPSCNLWQALMATCDLFHWLAVEVAGGLGYIYPTASESCTREWINCAYTSDLL